LGPGSWWAGGWEKQGVTEGGTRVVVFPAVAAGWRELGSWVWELMGLGAAWCKLHTIWTEHAAGGDRDKGAREQGSEGARGERMKKSSSLADQSTTSARSPLKKERVEHETSQVKTRKTRRAEGEIIESSSRLRPALGTHTRGQQVSNNLLLTEQDRRNGL
jgi:hypothetical protein